MNAISPFWGQLFAESSGNARSIFKTEYTVIHFFKKCVLSRNVRTNMKGILTIEPKHFQEFPKIFLQSWKPLLKNTFSNNPIFYLDYTKAVFTTLRTIWFKKSEKFQEWAECIFSASWTTLFKCVKLTCSKFAKKNQKTIKNILKLYSRLVEDNFDKPAIIFFQLSQVILLKIRENSIKTFLKVSQNFFETRQRQFWRNLCAVST